MKYMLLIHGNESVMNTVPVDSTGMSPAYAAYNEALIKAGVMRGGERLRPTTDAATIRVTNGTTEVLDGPYAETKEQFGGYYMIEVDDMDAAVAWAVRCPAAQHGAIEVRPIWPTRGE
ncbi:YciI family protein [Devosia sp.]|uniref:YciI family protein n=1 Tax=Devosia sp. TaxID=1871048 RepID=UPI0032634202